nr:tetratricopeptide repeat protein [Desulfobacterales bacterium]
MENVTLFSTEKHTQALEAITGKPEEKVLILVGPEDSGKTQLLKWLAEEISSDEKHLVFYHEICPHEHPSHFLFRFLLHLLNGTNFVSSRIGWEDIKKKFPGEGEFLNVLFNKDIRPFKHKLLEALKYMGSLDDQKKIVWIIDPRPRLESEETSSFFADVKDKLPPNIKVVIGQRDGDVLSQRQDIFPTIFLGEVDTEKKEEYLTEWSRGSLLPKDIMEKTIENQDCILGLQLTTHLFDMIGQDCSSQDVPKMVQTFYEEAQWLGASKILDWLSLVPFFIPSSELSAISETDEKELDSLIDDPFLSPFLERDDNRIRLGNNRLASLLSKDMIERGKDVNDYLKKHFLYLIDSLQHEKDRDNDELKEDLLRCSYLLQAIQDKDFFLAHFRELYKIMDRYGFNDGIEEILKKAISFQKELSGPLKDQVELLTLLGNRQRDQGDLDKALQSFQEALEMSRQSGDLEGEAEQLSRQGRIYFLHRNFEKALERHGQALYLYENVSNRLQLAREY